SPTASQNKTAQTKSAVSSGAVAATTQQKSPPVRSSASTEIIVSADESGDYVSINEAIRAARNGSRISVQPGLYAESLKIDKQIEIAGEGAARNIIVRSPDASCVLMQTDRAIIRNLTLQCAAGQAGKEVFGVDVSRGELTLQNCDVSSDSLACIGVRGQSTNALIRDCLIHDGADSGIYFFDSAAGTIEQCEIYRNKRAGVVIAQNANPTFKNCRVFSGENVGFFVYENGLGTIDDCDIFGHQDAEIAVTRGGSPVLRGCSIHNSNNSGVFVRDSGRALIEDCSIYENAAAGVAVDGASMVAVSASRINNNGKVAFRVKGGSIVRVENSDLRGNLLATWDTDAGVQIEKYGNQEY
ncbi:MAG TPA: pectinesterase family protein, partial [Pyrinomonadaceae bacterium]|nr:pectinesterase family protein [Pyrinomonadaceae bacterium]